MNRGQFSIEFIAVLSLFLILLTSIAIPMFESSSSDAGKLSGLARGRAAATSLAGGLNNVYGSGVGAKQTIRYSIPSDVTGFTLENLRQDGENSVIVKVWSDEWDDNVITVNTILPCDNLPIDADNLDNAAGEHLVFIEFEPPNGEYSDPWIRIWEGE
ncbi:hypothetical protein AKJ50_00215 [candidate division MSBL1 archaeon SCGC-AAA382A13]|uniref:Class III signal peptide-containing protein n=1 Tax=candidate division MSBL1 archaeon SCGC-AAA382A13 TaxID=1698279 RepID=A0A133VH10_9EURY|nr:hypothetical protein AKJ50_00215 [candidate division MSBL1 archaeon SCGC-AAA382A13]